MESESFGPFRYASLPQEPVGRAAGIDLLATAPREDGGGEEHGWCMMHESL